MPIGLSTVQQEKLTDAFTGYHALFKKSRGRPSKAAEQVAILTMRTPSGTAVEEYSWLDTIPSMHKWQGERRVKKLRANGFRVPNEDYESTIVIANNDIDDDRLGVYQPRIAAMPGRYPVLQLNLVAALLNGGFTTTGPGGACYDGKAFFSTAHVNGSGSKSNKLTKALSSSNPSDNFEAGMTMLQKMTDEEGEPLNLGLDSERLYLVVPPDLRATARAIVGAKTLSGGGDNPNWGQAKVMVLSGLGATKWMLIDAAMEDQKPVLFQDRKKLQSSDSRNGDGAFLTGNVMFGTHARCAMAYANWYTAIGSDGTT